MQAEEEENPFVPDDSATVREQNLRALLVLLPAKVMDGVVKAAMERAMLHSRRTATADAERQRRSLLLSRAQFRHTRRTQSSKEVHMYDSRITFAWKLAQRDIRDLSSTCVPLGRVCSNRIVIATYWFFLSFRRLNHVWSYCLGFGDLENGYSSTFFVVSCKL